MKTAFHGTTADSLKQMREDGFIGGMSGQNWIASEPNGVYMWDDERLEDDAFFMAKGSASVGLVFAKDCRRVILEIDIEGLEVSDDYSCENMEGAIVHYGQIPFSRVVRIWEDSDDLSFYKIFVLRGFIDLPLFNTAEIPEQVLTAVRELKTYYFWEDYHEVELTFENVPVTC